MTHLQYMGLCAAIFCTDETVPAWARVFWAVVWVVYTIAVAFTSRTANV